jgi:hypothetical protein
MSIVFVAIDSGAEFLQYPCKCFGNWLALWQPWWLLFCQDMPLVFFVKPLKDKAATPSYSDSVWWHLEY